MPLVGGCTCSMNTARQPTIFIGKVQNQYNAIIFPVQHNSLRNQGNHSWLGLGGIVLSVFSALLHIHVYCTSVVLGNMHVSSDVKLQ